MDGYLFAKQTRNLYGDNNEHIFALNTEFKEACPFLVANSAHVTDQIEKDAIESGFDICISLLTK